MSKRLLCKCDALICGCCNRSAGDVHLRQELAREVLVCVEDVFEKVDLMSPEDQRKVRAARDALRSELERCERVGKSLHRKKRTEAPWDP